MGRVLLLVASVVGLLRLALPFAICSPRLALVMLTPFLACATVTGARAWSSYMTEVAAKPAAVRVARRPAPCVSLPRVPRARVLSPLDLCRAAA
jgi:hypothetical protein